MFVVGIGVFLWVSFFSSPGQTVYNVPNLVGKTIEDARADSGVTVAQFQVVEGQEVDSTLPKGQIVNQDPQSGRNAAAGTTITVDISNGSGSTDVGGEPDANLVNQDKRLAINTLRELGFTEEAGNLVIREETSEDVTKDYVISTDPVAETDLADVEKVTLVVSSGVKTETSVIIPFLGMTEQEPALRPRERWDWWSYLTSLSTAMTTPRVWSAGSPSRRVLRSIRVPPSSAPEQRGRSLHLSRPGDHPDSHAGGLYRPGGFPHTRQRRCAEAHQLYGKSGQLRQGDCPCPSHSQRAGSVQ